MQKSKIYIKNIIKTNDVVLFLKGTKDSPQCGFSNVAVQILNYLNIKYFDINVLEDNDIRQSIKDFSDWPTIPQIYIKNEFIGGSDILRDMFETGEIRNLLLNKKINFSITNNSKS